VYTQHRYWINVWSGIFKDAVVGPFILLNRLNGVEYLNFLQIVIEDDLDNIPLQNWLQMWWMQDGALIGTLQRI
jgi:hypothetical protein